jgi:hypothetical protein
MDLNKAPDGSVESSARRGQIWLIVDKGPVLFELPSTLIIMVAC